MPIKPKIIVILGPTASGKSALGERLCLAFNGEIISADSRQVYRGLDLGTGKEQLRVEQHCLDIANPGERVTVAGWKEQAEAAIDQLLVAGKVPVVAGGSSLYVQALIDNFQFAPEDATGAVRAGLEKRSTAALFADLKRQDPAAAARLGPLNKRYLVRALEKLQLSGSARAPRAAVKYNFLLIGLSQPRSIIYKNIDRRVDERLEQGMLNEVRDLLASGVSADWLRSLGLEYRYLTEYLIAANPKLAATDPNLTAAVTKLKFATHRFARHQLMWWERFSKQSPKHPIHWISTATEAQALSQSFLAS